MNRELRQLVQNRNGSSLLRYVTCCTYNVLDPAKPRSQAPMMKSSSFGGAASLFRKQYCPVPSNPIVWATRYPELANPLQREAAEMVVKLRYKKSLRILKACM